jgi:acetyltransferase-like isoleucine patch superfamily enzyme
MEIIQENESRGGALSAILGIGVKLHSLWMQSTYPFAEFGRGTSIHSSCEIRRSASPQIRLGEKVYLAPDVWLDVVPGLPSSEAKIVLGDGCAIGRRCTISARNQIVLEADVLLAPSVLIRDHQRDDSDFEMPDDTADSENRGRIFIERNCWLGIGAVISCGSEDVTIGRNSVVAANAVVTRSFPPCSVIAGNPAKLVKRYDEEIGKWVKA